jgi:hypothetical protein
MMQEISVKSGSEGAGGQQWPPATRPHFRCESYDESNRSSAHVGTAG